MRVTISDVPIPGFPDDPPELTLEPESPRDLKSLERLVQKYKRVGVGYHSETGDILHLSLPLLPRGEQE